MGVSSCSIEDKQRKKNKAINIQSNEEATGKITKAKKINEFENIMLQVKLQKPKK